MGRKPWHKYSVSLALILPQISGQKFLQISIKTKTKQKATMGSALEWAPVQHPWGPAVLDASPPPGTTLHHCPKPGEVTRKERSRDNGIRWPARGAKSSVAATPGPSPKCPAKLEAIGEPQVPRGPRGTQDQPQHHWRAAE